MIAMLFVLACTKSTTPVAAGGGGVAAPQVVEPAPMPVVEPVVVPREPEVAPPPQPVDISLRDDDIQVVGDPNAERVVLQLSDWRCPHCERAFPIVMDAVREAPDAQLRLRTFPLSGPCNPDIASVNAPRCELAAAALCAANDGKLMDVLAVAFREEPDAMQVPPFDTPEFKACMDSPSTLETVSAHASTGTAAGILGTPTFYVREDGEWFELQQGADEVAEWLRSRR